MDNIQYEKLKLENQLCFPLYAASRLITRAYQPLLEELGLTYPQYLVLMVLWESDGLTVNKIADKLVLNTNTLTPLLKRMEENGLLSRQRSSEDERKVIITLTTAGDKLRHEAASIPEKLIEGFTDSNIKPEEIAALKSTLLKLIEQMR